MYMESLEGRELAGTSMLEEIRRNAEHRLREIEPLIEEAHRLRDVLEVIGRRTASGGSHAAPPLGEADAEQRERAARGANKRIILDLVASRPGIRAAEIAQLTGLKRTVVASTVSRLKRQGALMEHNQGGVCLAKPHTTHRPRDPRPRARRPHADRPSGSRAAFEERVEATTS